MGTPNNAVVAATQTNATLTVVKEQPKDQVKPPTVAEKRKNEPLNVMPLEDRLHRLNELFGMQTKYNRLLASKNKLNEFKLNSNDENVVLTINDRGTRIDFSTSNSEVIKEVFKALQKAIDEKIKAIEPLLKW